MSTTALEQFIQRTRANWGPLSSELVDDSRQALAALAGADPSEPWLAALHRDAPARRELVRDPTHGFVLLAHTEPEGLYRSPHDHGRGWVVYAVQRGEVVMSTYARVEDDAGVALIKRDERVLRAGQAQLFLPGDVHDTRSVSGSALLFRFASTDLERESAERRLTRFVERDGRWRAPT
ncbi:MAG: hypothetical protein U0269_34270 [Polyangiales bacterium]